MPTRDLRLRVQDMLTEIAVIEQSTTGLDFEIFAQNPQTLRAVLYSLAVIGEAVASAINDLELLNPSLPWRPIRGLRNAVIHEYFRVGSWERSPEVLQQLLRPYPKTQLPNRSLKPCVEILSPGNTVGEIHTKIVEYFDNGTQIVWVIHPDEKYVLVYHSVEPDRFLRSNDRLNLL